MTNFPPQGTFGLPNVLRGMVPTVTGWGVNPINLANATDRDFTIATTIGSTVVPGAFGNAGTFDFDLGSIQTVLFGCKYGLSGSAGGALLHLQASDDNITFSRNDLVDAQIFSAVEQIGFSMTEIVSGRYLRIFLTNDTAGATIGCRIFEAFAFRVVI